MRIASVCPFASPLVNGQPGNWLEKASAGKRGVEFRASIGQMFSIDSTDSSELTPSLAQTVQNTRKSPVVKEIASHPELL